MFSASEPLQRNVGFLFTRFSAGALADAMTAQNCNVLLSDDSLAFDCSWGRQESRAG